MKDYDALPMLMSEADIARSVRELLADARVDPKPDPQVVAEYLVTMVSRQSSHHRPFAPELKKSIDGWVAEVWSTDSVPLFDALATLAANTASARTKRLLEVARRDPNPTIREISEETLSQI